MPLERVSLEIAHPPAPPPVAVAKLAPAPRSAAPEPAAPWPPPPIQVTIALPVNGAVKVWLDPIRNFRITDWPSIPKTGILFSY